MYQLLLRGCRGSGGRAGAGNALPGCDRLSEGMASGRRDRQARIDQRDMPDMTEPALANDQTESTEANEPAESTEANEPAEPMDRMEPADPTDRIDPVEPMDKMDPLEPMLRIDPPGPVHSREKSLFGIGRFSQQGRNYAAANDSESRRTRRILPPARAASSTRCAPPARRTPAADGRAPARTRARYCGSPPERSDGAIGDRSRRYWQGSSA